MTEIDLSVDDEPVELSDTIRLHQSEPLRGGHQYRLTLRGRALSAFDRFGFETSTTERPHDPVAVFFAIDSIAAGMPGEAQGSARFILNTVEQVVRHGDEVSVSGVCSVPVE